MPRDGNKLVDLTQNWDKGREVTGDNTQLTGYDPKQDKTGDGAGTAGGGTAGGGKQPTAEELKKPPPEPEWGFLKVSPAMMEDAETSILSATKTAITDFETFRDKILAEQDWVFWAQSDYASKNISNLGKAGLLEKNGDPHPKETKDRIDGELALLQSCGGMIQLVGTFVGQLNDSAQQYAKADKDSFPPDFG